MQELEKRLQALEEIEANGHRPLTVKRWNEIKSAKGFKSPAPQWFRDLSSVAV
jgi:hypothetical protein